MVVQQDFDGKASVGQDVEGMVADNVGSDGSHIGDHIAGILVDHGKASCAQASEAEH